MAEEKYNFIEENIKPKKKRILKEHLFRLLKIIISGIFFGAAATGIFVIAMTYFYNGSSNDRIKIQTATPVPNNNIPEEASDYTQKPVNSANKLADSADAGQSSNGTGDISDYAEFGIDHYSDMYKTISEYCTSYNDTIVTVAKVVEGTDYFSNPVESSDSFSGLVIRIDNNYIYVLTEYDGIEDNSNYQIVFNNGVTANAGILGSDKVTGLAVICAKLEDVGNDLLETVRTAIIGPSDEIKEGDLITAIGNPAGNMYSVSFGMITSKPVTKYMVDRQVSLFHTNMQSQKKSGGVVMNINGQVVGIITHRFDEEEENLLSFIGTSQLDELIEQLINNIDRGGIGIVANNIKSGVRKELGIDHGIYITSVLSESPAMNEGLVAGDIITAVGKYEINTVEQLSNIISEHVVGDSLEFAIHRSYAKKDTQKKVKIVLKDMEDIK